MAVVAASAPSLRCWRRARPGRVVIATRPTHFTNTTRRPTGLKRSTRCKAHGASAACNRSRTMSNTGLEVFLVSMTPGLSEALQAYEGVHIGNGTMEFAARLLASDRPPQVVYIEDSACPNVEELWNFVQAARGRRVTVLIGMQGPALSRMADFVDAGLPITDGRGAQELSTWIGD